MRRSAIGVACLVIGASGAVVPGCGGASDRPAATGGASTAVSASPEASIAQVKAAALRARSVRVDGDVSGATALNVDLVLAAERRGRGILTVDGRALDVVRDDQDFYVKAYAGVLGTIFRDADPSRLAEVGARYVRVSADDPRFRQLARILQIDGFVTALLETNGTLRTVPGKTVDGQPTFGVQDTSTGGGTIYARVAAPAYPLLVEGPQGTIRLSEWDAPVTITAPVETVEAATLRRVTP